MPNPEDAYKSKPDVSMPLFNKHLEQVRKDRENLDRICQMAHARRNDPETSKQAAASVLDVHMVRSNIHFILRQRGPLTDEGIALWWKQMCDAPVSPSGLRTRRKELVRMGLVVDSGRVGKTASGRQTIIWKVAK